MPEIPEPLEGRLEEVADSHGTPTYVTSLDAVRKRFQAISDAFQDARVQYAAKANTNPDVLHALHDEDACIDTVSLGEVEIARRVGFEGEEIMYTGVNPPEGEISGVIDRGAFVNADCRSVLHRVAEHPDADEVGVRVDPDVGAGHHEHVVTAGGDTKFGVSAREAPEVFDLAESLGLTPICLHMHVGSGVLDPDPLVEAIENLVSIAHRVEDSGHSLRYVDVGGGLGVPYRPDEEPLDLEAFADRVDDVWDLDATLVLEPGRYLVAESTVLLTRVNTRKEGYAGVDAGFNTLLRPAMYGSYHHVTNVSRSVPVENVDVVGPICENGDFIARDREIGMPEEGDLLAVHTAGAYGYAMTSRYNSRRLPAEVVVDDEVRLSRPRDSFEDLYRGTSIE